MSGLSFPIHLCQPDSAKSCAACCGIYNFKDNSREAVNRRLSRNTASVRGRGSRPTPEDLAVHTRKWRTRDNGAAKRFPTIFNCEFVGFLDESRGRIGCLLHPMVHDGVDLRPCSFYGKELCAGHFCPSYHYLSADEQAFVVKTLDDWYLYGLVITDIDLVRGVHQAVSDRLGQAVPARLLDHAPARLAVQKLWQWKVNWPYRRDGSDGFGKYLFIGDQYEEIRIPYEQWGTEPSPYHRILLALGSVFHDLEELKEAERQIEQGLAQVVDALARTSASAQEPSDRPFS